MASANVPQISPELKRLLWDTGSPSLWSLLDMLKAYAHFYSVISSSLTNLSHDAAITAETPEAAKKANEWAVLVLKDLQQKIGETSLVATRARIDRILVNYDVPPLPVDLEREFRTLQQTLEDELRYMRFLYLPPLKAATYEHPLTGFRKTCEAFPSTRNYIRDATRAHALGLYNAAVFHGMAVAQVGLYALASHLGAVTKHPLSLSEWSTIIDAIEREIKPLREGPRTEEKDKKLTFYSECAAQFRYFKDAWRNHICHMRDEYDEGQAQSIITHVRDFMENLAGTVKEIPVPPIVLVP
jgi:hypothetical protein